MKSSFDNHPAIVSAKKKMKTRYIAAAISLAVCLAVFAVGFFVKPSVNKNKLEDFSRETSAGTLVKSEVAIIAPLFSQDIVDESGNVTGEMYHILAANTDAERFILSTTKEYYEENLKKLENNATEDIESGKIEILDPENNVEVIGYAREMSNNLTEQLGKNFEGYENIVFPYSLEAVESDDEIKPMNYFYIAGGFIAVITLCILFTAVTATADYSRKKEKLEKKLAEKAKGKK